MRSILRRLGISAVMAATLVAATALPAHAETTGTISGKIAGTSTGWVSAYDTSYRWIAGSSISPDGSYSVQVPAGDYKLEVWTDGIIQWMHQKTSFSQADTFTVTAGSVVVVNETLLPTGSLAGTLLDGTAPVAGVRVSAQPLDGSAYGWATTDEQGRFTMPRLLPGRYRVDFQLGDGVTQFYRQQVDPNLAEPVTVAVGERTEITEILRPTGSASGRLTENGVGVAGAQVYWRSGDWMTAWATTDAEGRYRIPRLFASEYTVSFTLPDQRSQWAHGKISEATADRFTVVAGAETVVDETVLPTGQVRVHAVDAKTGQPVTGFCAEISGVFSCTDEQVASFAKVPVGRHKITVYPYGDGYLSGANGFVDVIANGVADPTVAVNPAGIITTVVRDRSSGEPVPGVCLHAVKLRFATLAGGGEGPTSCSDEQGRVRIGQLIPDTYTLFARVEDGVHGMQWVAPNGGTGSQFAARRLDIEGGQMVDVPPVLLDPAGSVSGRVTDKATGAPVPDAVVSLLTAHPAIGAYGPSAVTDAYGRYTFANLGPYDWPLHFGHFQYAAQWSGGVPSRLIAKPVRVKVGQTATADAELTTGTVVRGTVRLASGEAVPDGYVTAYEAVTGDIAGSIWISDGTYQMRVLGPTGVRFRIETGVGIPRWHLDKDDFDHATVVFIPASGTKTLDLIG